MPHYVVLGGGLVGRVMALDLAGDAGARVTVADRDEALLARLASQRLDTRRVDLGDAGAVSVAVADADVVVGAAPGHLGFRVLRAVIEAGKPIADIAFMPENFLDLDGLARERGVTAIVDCGVAPGLSNLLCGRAMTLLDHAERMLILVGGLPKRRVWPYEYRIVFSAVDVIEEYVRPARWVEHGRLIVAPALTDVELVDLPRVGTLEAFNTDGLRSLAHTLDVPFMKEKTLRYPGHADRMRMLRETGFFSQQPLPLADGRQVRPFDVTTRLLFDAWKLPEGEADLTVMRVVVEGTRAGAPASCAWDLYDELDPRTGFTSMARCTGFTNVIAARLLASGDIERPGVSPPELLAGDDRVFSSVLDGLERRGVRLAMTTG